MLRIGNMLLIGTAVAASLIGGTALAEKLTIATVNNGDMIRMQKLTDDFTANNPGIELEWVTWKRTFCVSA